MKYLLALLFAFCNVIFASAQTATGSHIDIIYIDNFVTPSDPGLSDVVTDSLHRLVQKVAAKNGNVLMYLTDGKDANQTTSTGSMEQVYNDLNNHIHSNKPVDEKYDTRELRDAVLDKMENKKVSSINMSCYISSDIIEHAVTGASYILSFFPAELSSYAPDADITVSIYYSAKNKDIKDKLLSSLNFYKKGEYADAIKYRIISL